MNQPTDRKDAINPFGKLTFLVVDDFKNFRFFKLRNGGKFGGGVFEIWLP